MSDCTATSEGPSTSASEDETKYDKLDGAQVRQKLCDANYQFYKLSTVNIANSMGDSNLQNLALTSEGYTTWRDLDKRWGYWKEAVFWSESDEDDLQIDDVSVKDMIIDEQPENNKVTDLTDKTVASIN